MTHLPFGKTTISGLFQLAINTSDQHLLKSEWRVSSGVNLGDSEENVLTKALRPGQQQADSLQWSLWGCWFVLTMVQIWFQTLFDYSPVFRPFSCTLNTFVCCLDQSRTRHDTGSWSEPVKIYWSTQRPARSDKVLDLSRGSEMESAHQCTQLWDSTNSLYIYQTTYAIKVRRRFHCSPPSICPYSPCLKTQITSLIWLDGNTWWRTYDLYFTSGPRLQWKAVFRELAQLIEHGKKWILPVCHKRHITSWNIVYAAWYCACCPRGCRGSMLASWGNGHSWQGIVPHCAKCNRLVVFFKIYLPSF